MFEMKHSRDLVTEHTGRCRIWLTPLKLAEHRDAAAAAERFYDRATMSSIWIREPWLHRDSSLSRKLTLFARLKILLKCSTPSPLKTGRGREERRPTL
jgi:hypothetical protein